MTETADVALGSLAAQLPAGAVSVADADRFATSTDAWVRSQLTRSQRGECTLPRAVVWPSNTAELCTVVRWAAETGIPLIPFGAGSNVVGAATSEEGHVVVDLKRMQNIVRVQSERRLVTAQAGIVGELLERQLNRLGHTLGHFPSSIYCSTLGGWIATRGAGQFSSRYGKIEDMVLGGTVVTGAGKILEIEPAPARPAELDLWMGAEGAAVLWSEATLRIQPLPEARLFRAFDFADLARAVEAAEAWVHAGLHPCVVRIYDPLDSVLQRSHGGDSTEVVGQAHDHGPDWLAWVGANLPKLTAWASGTVLRSCRTIIGFEGDPKKVAAEMNAAREVAQAYAALDAGEEPGQRWFDRRYAISYKQANAFRADVVTDTMEVACTWDRVLPTYHAVRAAALGADTQVLAHFSHVYLGGCSIYFTFAMPARAGVNGYDRLWQVSLGAAISAGANVSHHHGIGRLKSEALAHAQGGAAACRQQVAAQHDPGGVLNPSVLERNVPEAAPRIVSKRAPDPGPARGIVCAAASATLGDVETRIAASGMTLGLVAEALADTSVHHAARQGWLWRCCPQLALIESSVAAVDGRVDDVDYSMVPAPRGATGPELSSVLLDGDVDQLWLRCHVRGKERRCYAGTVASVLASAERLTRDGMLLGAAVAVVVHDDTADKSAAARLVVDAPVLPVESVFWQRASECVADLKLEKPIPLPNVIPSEASALLVSGTWHAITAFIADSSVAPKQVVLFAADAVGAAALVPCREGSEEARLMGRAAALHGVARKPRPLKAGLHSSAAPGHVGDAHVNPTPRRAGTAEARIDAPGPHPRHSLQLSEHVAALENCTWCPKLCRFACTVSVASGLEAVTPKQLMMAANLDRDANRPLTADTAARLWNCVDCGACSEYCAHGNAVSDVLQEARAELVSQEAAPPAVASYLEHLLKVGSPPDRPPGDHPARSVEAEDDGPASPTALVLGCQGSALDPEPARTALALARAKFGAVRVVRGAVGCCGAPLWKAGDREGFKQHAERFAGQWAGAERLVVDDPGCVWAFRDLYARVGVTVPKVVALRELLVGEPQRAFPATRWTFHQPCDERRRLGHEPLSEMLEDDRASAAPDSPDSPGSSDSMFEWSEAYMPGSVLEETGGCCGGGMLESIDSALNEQVGACAAADLTGGGAELVLTTSPTCRRRLARAGVDVDDACNYWLPTNPSSSRSKE